MAKSKVDSSKDKLINIRVNAEDYHLFQCVCASIGSTPSELLRTYMSTTLAPFKVKIKNGEIKLEDLECLLPSNENK